MMNALEASPMASVAVATDMIAGFHDERCHHPLSDGASGADAFGGSIASVLVNYAVGQREREPFQACHRHPIRIPVAISITTETNPKASSAAATFSKRVIGPP
jgi:hypothetical protein